MTGNNYGTIKNVRIRNATVPSRNYSADFRSGILCSNNYGTIENCAVENAVIKTRKKTEYDDEKTIKLRVHSALAGGNYGTIKDEYNYQHKIFGKYPAFDNVCPVYLLLYKRERSNRRTYLRRRKDTDEY